MSDLPLPSIRTIASWRSVLPRAVLALGLAAASCGGGGGGTGSFELRGRLFLQRDFQGGFSLPAAGGGPAGSIGPRAEDVEPNDHLFSAGDLGHGDRPISVTGRTGGVGDPRDLFVAGPLEPPAGTSGLYELSLTGAPGLGVVVAEGEATAPARAMVELAAGGRAVLRLSAGAQLVFAVRGPAARALDYRLRFAPLAARGVLPAVTPLRGTGPRAAALAADWSGAAAPEESTGAFVLGFPLASEAARRETAGALAARGLVHVRGEGDVQLWRDPGLAATQDPAQRMLLAAEKARELRRALPALRFVSPELRAPLSTLAGCLLQGSGASPNDPLYQSLQWNLRLARFDRAWPKSVGRSDEVIAFLDTGFMVGHPDLAARFSKYSFDFISDPVSAGDGDGYDPDPSEPLEFEPGTLFHGTYVSGIAGAVTNNVQGIAGAAWRPKILGLRIIGIRGSSSYDRIQALRYLQGLPNDSKRILPASEQPRIINMSFLLRLPTKAEYAEIQALARRNVLMVAAMGNDAKNLTAPVYPAGWPEVIAVGAVGPDGKKTSYSNTGSFIEFAAPGGIKIAGPGGIVSTWAFRDPDTGAVAYGYNSFLGTSVATPHVSALLSLIDAVYPDVTLAEARSILKATAVDKGAAGWDSSYGFGLIDAGAAVAEAARRWSAPQPKVDPMAIDFGRSQTEGTMHILNTGGGTLARFAAVPVGSPDPHLALSFDRLFAPATLTVRLDRKGVAPGVYKRRYELKTNAGSVFVDFAYEMPIPAPAAPLHVRLVDGRKILAETDADSRGAFRLTGLPAGSFTLQAGVDQNGNGRLGDSQEWYLEVPVRLGGPKAPALNGLVVPWRP